MVFLIVALSLITAGLIAMAILVVGARADDRREGAE
jgi:hypothetical protein